MVGYDEHYQLTMYTPDDQQVRIMILESED